MRRSTRFFSIALASASVVAPLSTMAQAQAPARAQRLEARQERQEARQAARLGNQADYYGQQTWSQLDPWIARNQVAPLQRAANAVVGATERTLNAGANVAAEVADAVTPNANVGANAGLGTRYGYSDANANVNAASQQGWFYDYYSYNPTYYSAPANGSNVYSGASRYYDLNNDGVYDSLSSYRDSDKDGAYSTYDRFNFAANKPDVKSNDVPDSSINATRHTVKGTIEATKVAKVNGSENLVVRVSTNGDAKNGMTIVDLGSADRWSAETIKNGDQLSASGPVEQVGDKQVLIAETATIGKQQSVTISRSGATMEGQVVDVTRAEVKGAEHVLAVVETSSGRQLVDLGPASNLKFKLEPQTKISFQGVPVQLRDHSVILAEQVSLNGQRVTIQRW